MSESTTLLKGADMPLISLNDGQKQWLEDEIALTEEVLREKLQMLDSLRNEISGLRGRHALLQTFLDAIAKSVNRQEESSEVGESYQQRTPMEMVRDEYKGMMLGDIAARVLDEYQSVLTPKQLSEIIYDAKTDEEFERARNSLSAELRAGAKGESPRWKKIGRYAYASLQVCPNGAETEEVPRQKSA